MFLKVKVHTNHLETLLNASPKNLVRYLRICISNKLLVIPMFIDPQILFELQLFSISIYSYIS